MKNSDVLADAHICVDRCDAREEIRLYGTPLGLKYLASVIRSVAEFQYPPNSEPSIGEHAAVECLTITNSKTETFEFVGADLEIRRMDNSTGSTDWLLTGAERYANQFLKQRREFISQHLHEFYAQKNGQFTPEELAGLDEEEQWFEPIEPELFSKNDAIVVAYPIIDESPRLVIAGTSTGLESVAESLTCMADVEYGPYNPDWPENSEHHHSWLDGDQDVMLKCGMGLLYGRCDHRKDGSVDWYHDCLSTTKERYNQFLDWVRTID